MWRIMFNVWRNNINVEICLCSLKTHNSSQYMHCYYVSLFSIWAGLPNLVIFFPSLELRMWVGTQPGELTRWHDISATCIIFGFRMSNNVRKCKFYLWTADCTNSPQSTNTENAWWHAPHYSIISIHLWKSYIQIIKIARNYTLPYFTKYTRILWPVEPV